MKRNKGRKEHFDGDLRVYKSATILVKQVNFGCNWPHRCEIN